MRRIISVLIVVIFVFALFFCNEDGTSLSFLPGLKKAVPEDFAGKEPISFSDLKLPMFLEDGTQIDSTLSIYEIIIKNKAAPFPFIDYSGNIKAIVFCKVTDKEFKYWEKMATNYLNNLEPDTAVDTKETNLIGKKTVPFSLKSIDNKYFSLDNLKGNIIVINFWFAGCRPCVTEIPLLNDIVKKYRSSNVTFLAITFDTKEKVDDFLKTRQFDYNIITEGMKTISDYGVRNYPTHLIIDDDMNIVYHRVGFNKIAIDDLDKKIESLLTDVR